MKNNQLTYHNQIVPYSRDELVAKLKNALTDSRFQHVLRVEQTAMDLAERNGVDVEKASIGGLVHDYAKQRPDKDFIEAIKTYHLDPELLNYGNAIWHGVVGWLFVKTELKITDIDILNAVRYHTVGHQFMTPLEQIVYMADYIEPGRNFPGVDEARKITFDNLQAGVAYQTKQTLSYLVAHNKPVFPQTIVTYNSWVPGSGIE
ncbi:putative nicotinate-nucleotide adenylyltransferase [Lentilactobacillus parabuchneri]|jgi:predicted HD superfamily hydrolase involved in NAD metabolism|uniref:bis(5'-nucleosyl)-tetraphosphatase (symmetrical) n=2 Tax=Lentilactobacillus parabuchneri TaxID=152331 RepID=A0A1X1FBD8_9LACO|nr:bis(5'-nucleosyl)-tetraphosphatase (symmetrical) YqeK [Lentilactobacillus parabuchneri]APR08398.1 putative nicotinate-nucleotide adenylyltransferase [Lentilactobacillus parabuchneri]KRM47939.1 metal dependent phosphohydrolase [Lentilactobacillus parabuchneri DSM 5707 = NBRC 107865]KRN74560.1 metal dependent phosphohydrolase [Lentilactobacillus parabuchneri]MBW0222015.1 bis(5'-nucleosyl)-tetraphosphatase (symmetrical) YqeK [Lentilactobacillus parabuchneri]MBW0244761.1 bis(5'-nucleosyl)-tetra